MKKKSRNNQLFTIIYLFLCELYSLPLLLPSPLLVQMKQSTTLDTCIAQVKIVRMPFLFKKNKKKLASVTIKCEVNEEISWLFESNVC